MLHHHLFLIYLLNTCFTESAVELSQKVKRGLRESALTPARMDYIAENIVTEYDKEFNDSKIKDYEKLIRKLDRDIDKCFQLMVQSNSSAINKTF